MARDAVADRITASIAASCSAVPAPMPFCQAFHKSEQSAAAAILGQRVGDA
jgi:hypothetical protein